MRATDYTILLFEEVVQDAEHLQSLVSLPSRERHQIVHVRSMAEGLARLPHQHFDVIILNIQLPDGKGLDGLRYLTTHYPDIPIVTLSALKDIEEAKRFLEHGAQEYLIKGQISRGHLCALLQSAVCRQQKQNCLINEKNKLDAFSQELQLQLKSSEAKFQTICDWLRDAVVVLSAQRTIVYWNYAAQQIFGYAEEEVLSHPLTTILPAETEHLLRPMWDALQTGENKSQHCKLSCAYICHRSGYTVPVELTVVPVCFDQEWYAVGIFHDLSAQISQEQKLSRSMAAFAAVVDNSKDGVLVVDEQGYVLFANAAARALFSGENNALVGSLFGLPVSTTKETEIEILTKGQPLYASMIAADTSWDGKKAYTVSIRDISAHKQLLHEQERLIGELRQALDEINTLKGIIPICSYCKSVMDDDGIWKRIEEYMLHRIPDVHFSHGICEQCWEKHYDEIMGDDA